MDLSFAQQLDILLTRLQSGVWQAFDARSHLDLMLADLGTWLEAVEALEPPPGDRGETRDDTLAGLYGYLNAIQSMGQFLENGDAAAAAYAQDLAADAEAMLVQTRRRIEDETEALLDEEHLTCELRA